MRSLVERLRRAPAGRTGFVLAAIRRERSDSVIDIGSGEGWLLGELGGVGRRVGVDTDPRMVERARRQYPDCDYFQLNGDTLPFGCEEFAAAVLADVVEHVGDENKQRVVDEALRVLRPGGILVITVPHRGIWSSLDPLDFKRRYPRLYRIFQRISRREPLTPPKIGHKHVTCSEITQLIGARARIETVEYSGWIAPLGDLPLAIAFLLCSLRALPPAWLHKLGQWQTLEASIPASRLFAGHLRLVARRV